MRALRFHWSLSQAGNVLRRAQATEAMSGLPDLPAQLALCRRAEEHGVESMLMAIGFNRPDPVLLSVALGQRTRRIGFMVACRPGLVSPTAFVQQINTLSAVVGGRVSVNVVGGHTPHELAYYGDFLPHDERYARTGEFLAVCRALWRHEAPVDFSGRHYEVEGARLHTRFESAGGARAPEVYVGGSSPQAVALAAAHADCLWRFPDAPERLAAEVRPVLAAGKEVGLLVGLIARPTRDEARSAAAELVARCGGDSRRAHVDFANRSDSVGFRTVYRMANEAAAEWVTPWLWTGAVPYLGAPAIALVGSFDEVAGAMLAYRDVGVSQFLLLGWPDLDELTRFGDEVLPRVRRDEGAPAGAG